MTLHYFGKICNCGYDLEHSYYRKHTNTNTEIYVINKNKINHNNL